MNDCPGNLDRHSPGFRSGSRFPLCSALVAAPGVRHDHLVPDAGSDDGSLDWLSRYVGFVWSTAVF